MKYGDFVEKVAAATGGSKADAKTSTDAVFAALTDALTSGEEVTAPGFGTFKVKTNAARTGRNPQTGEEIQIAESKGVGFKQATALKAAMNA